jgi:hypothetical protein
MQSASTFLRRVLLADAVVSGAAGVLMLFGAGLLAGLLGLPAALLQYAGLSLFPFVAVVSYAATREPPPRPLVTAIVSVNALWVAGSVALLLSGWVIPTLFGYGFVLAQAVAVAILAELQLVGLRRASPQAA